MAKHTCVICATELTGRQTRFCSKLCSIRGYSNERERYRYSKTCQHCGKEFAGQTKATRFCSVVCGVASNHGEGRRPKSPRRRAAIAKARKAAAGIRGQLIHVAGQCPRCGANFVRTFGRRIVVEYLPRHCSARCAKREARERRRARESGAFVTRANRIAVHTRCNWICRICGDPVDRTAVVPDLAAPVLDHVVPLARGGAHTESNLQTAHFYCNSVKRDQLNFGLTSV